MSAKQIKQRLLDLMSKRNSPVELWHDLFAAGQPQDGFDQWTAFLAQVTPEAVGHAALSSAAARVLFKRLVRIVEIEPHSYCNRRCAFCTNALIDRRGANVLFPDEVYQRLLADLASIGYAGKVLFARYSEPLAHEHIFDMIRATRVACPASEIMIISNGDYLDRDRLSRLANAGLNRLHVSIYLANDEIWTGALATQRVAAFRQRLGLQPHHHQASDVTIYEDYKFPGLALFSCGANNLDVMGYDRGGALQHLTNSSFCRHAPCPMVFRNFTVDYNGLVMPCCNLRGDDPTQARFSLGDLRTSDIFTIYGGMAAGSWRRRLAGFGRKSPPCATCKQNLPSDEQSESLRAAWHRDFERNGLKDLTS